MFPAHSTFRRVPFLGGSIFSPSEKAGTLGGSPTQPDINLACLRALSLARIFYVVYVLNKFPDHSGIGAQTPGHLPTAHLRFAVTPAVLQCTTPVSLLHTEPEVPGRDASNPVFWLRRIFRSRPIGQHR
jgi:hypothetical protein